MPVSNRLITTGQGGATLHNFNDEVIVRVRLPPVKIGVWLLMGRVLIFNTDNDAQWASARLTTDDGATKLDEVDPVRIDGWFSQAMSLQAVLSERLGDEPIVDLRCSTYSGIASDGSLFALLVDDLESQ
jgi:hypothetical protein